MKLLTNRITVLVAALALSSHVASAAIHTFTASLDGPQAATPSLGTGTGTFLFDDVTREITGTITFQNLQVPATLSHIHVGAPGVSGGVIVDFVPFTPAATSGTITSPALGAPGVLLVPVSQVANFLAGNTYYNIHTGDFPGGEIRGQIVPVPEPTSLSLAGLGAVGIALRAWRKRRGN